MLVIPYSFRLNMIKVTTDVYHTELVKILSFFYNKPAILTNA